MIPTLPAWRELTPVTQRPGPGGSSLIPPRP